MLLLNRFMNVKKINKEIPRCTLSGSTELNFVRKQAAPQERNTPSLLSIRFALFLYRLKWEDFLLVLIIRYLPNKSRLPYGVRGTEWSFFEVFQARKTIPKGLKTASPHAYHMKVCCYHESATVACPKSMDYSEKVNSTFCTPLP